MDIGRERSYNDPVLCVPEFIVKGLPYKLFALGITGPLCIGAVGHHQQYAPVAVLGKPVQFHDLPVNRSLVNLKVPGMDDQADRRMDCHANRVRNAVVDAHELQLKDAGANTFAGLDDI